MSVSRSHNEVHFNADVPCVRVMTAVDELNLIIQNIVNVSVSHVMSTFTRKSERGVGKPAGHHEVPNLTTCVSKNGEYVEIELGSAVWDCRDV